ncbi:LysR family transcriptional regulator [Natronosporangium hydrolyticum]|uniref:LysR family transcriptional regulator n=1 Tax=Natronosporangium hydrolyticum TaxID=2811111 RepID=A0A895YD83_9ACTN|nr:LysR family transcriptional regulator [Natronosporangium hydrolyticum]QSB15764.1 LysR family transcriptional regulator [Natronosporangium hydrolyticum]
MKLELRHLRIVCAIADTGSITKAAAALGLAQPALAAQLKRIERAIGGQLFERDRHGARPTPLGELMLTRARILLPAIQGLEDEAARLASTAATTMKAYRIGTVNGPILSGLMQRLTSEYPDAVLSTHTSWEASELAEMLATGRLDYALVGACGSSSPPTALGSGAERDLAWHVVAVDAVFILLPEDHPLAGQREVDLSDLADASWVMTPGDGCFRSCFAAACARAGFTARDMYEGDVRTCVELVEAGTAIAPCQSSFRPPPGLVSVPIAGTPLHWRHLLGWHPETPASQHADRIAYYAVEAYQDAVERLPRYAEWLRRQPQFGAQPLAAAKPLSTQ